MRVQHAKGRRAGARHATMLVVLLSGLLGAGGMAIAGDGPATGPGEQPESPAPTTSPADVHQDGDGDATCREWRDGCIVCRRQDDGAVACSTPGIACLPAAVVCTVRK